MGLLDFDNPEVRMGMGLLALGQMPRSQGFQGLATLLQMQDAAARNKAESDWVQEARQQKRKEWSREEAAAQRAAEVQAAIPSLFGGTTQGSVSFDTSNGVPFVSKGVQVTQPSMRTGGFDVQRALQLGLQPEQIQKLVELQNVGRQKVARTVEGTDAQGRPVTYQFDEYGQPVGQAVGQWKTPMLINQGDRQTLLDPATRQPVGSFTVNMSAAERDASARGWASNALARERMAFDMAGGAEAGKPQYRDGQWVMPPRNMQPGQAVPAVPSTAVKEANEALALIKQAEQIIPKATGSYLGTGVDAAARAFGVSTPGDRATGQLQALEGALVSKMPKMSGPQSDKDVQLYRQMAGVIGDPTIPTARKLAALETIKEIQSRYAGPQAPQAPAPMPGQ
ncbi:MAG: hypothetical protein ACK40S_12935, partial [Burkholderiaceae bacterium]